MKLRPHVRKGTAGRPRLARPGLEALEEISGATDLGLTAALGTGLGAEPPAPFTVEVGPAAAPARPGAGLGAPAGPGVPRPEVPSGPLPLPGAVVTAAAAAPAGVAGAAIDAAAGPGEVAFDA